METALTVLLWMASTFVVVMVVALVVAIVVLFKGVVSDD